MQAKLPGREIISTAGGDLVVLPLDAVIQFAEAAGVPVERVDQFITEHGGVLAGFHADGRYVVEIEGDVMGTERIVIQAE